MSKRRSDHDNKKIKKKVESKKMKIDKTLSDYPFVPRVQCGAGKRFENVGYVSVCGTLGSTSHEGGVETRTLAREIMSPFSEFLSAATRPWLGG